MQAINTGCPIKNPSIAEGSGVLRWATQALSYECESKVAGTVYSASVPCQLVPFRYVFQSQLSEIAPWAG